MTARTRLSPRRLFAAAQLLAMVKNLAAIRRESNRDLLDLYVNGVSSAMTRILIALVGLKGADALIAAAQRIGEARE